MSNYKPSLRDQLALAEALARLNELGPVVNDSIRPHSEKMERDETREHQLAQLSKIFEGKPHYQRVTQDKAALEALLQLATRAPVAKAAPSQQETKAVPPAPQKPAKKESGFSQLHAPVVHAEPKPKAGLGRSRILRPREN